MISITYCNGVNRDSACFIITRLLLVLSLSSVVKIKMRTPITDLCHTSCFWDIKLRRAVYSCIWWLLCLGYWINNGSFDPHRCYCSLASCTTSRQHSRSVVSVLVETFKGNKKCFCKLRVYWANLGDETFYSGFILFRDLLLQKIKWNMQKQM